MGAIFRRHTSVRDIGDPGQPLFPPRQGGGRSTAGQRVTVSTALTLSAVWSCVMLRADLLSTMPLDLYRKLPGGVPYQISKPPVLTTPGGDRMYLEEWLFASQVSLDLRGFSAGIVVARDGLGYPRQIELQNPDTVTYGRLSSGAMGYRVNGKGVDTAHLWLERANSFPGQPLGLSPIAFAASSVGVALAAQTFGAEWFANGATPSAVLTSDQKIDSTQAKTIKQRFVEAIGNRREPLVLGQGLTYSQISVAADESQFLATMKYGVQEACRIFGRVPPELIGAEAGSSMTYANVEQRSLTFLTYGFGPTLVRRENALSRLTPVPQFCKFNRGALLATDLHTRYTAHAIGIAGKFLTPDEARSIEDRPPLTPEEKAELALVPLVVGPTGAPKALPTLPASEEEAVAP